MNYSQRSTLKTYLSKAIWTLLFAFNCCVLLYIISHICKIWTNQNFDMIKTFLIFDQEEEFKNIISAKHQLWSALTAETVLLVLGSYFTFDFLVKVKNIRLNIIGSLALFFCIFTGESLLLFFPAPDKAIEIQTCESIPLKNCSEKNKNCTPKYITWNKENHYCNLIELERQRMIKFLEQKAIAHHQSLIEYKKYKQERAKLLAKRAAEAAKAEAAALSNIPPVPVKKVEQAPIPEPEVAPIPVLTKQEPTETNNPIAQPKEPKAEPVQTKPEKKPVVIQSEEKKQEITSTEQPKPIKKKVIVPVENTEQQSENIPEKKAETDSTEPLSAPTSLLKNN